MANMNFGVNILPKANNTYSLGNSDYKWNLYTNSINGTTISNLVLPTVSSTDNGKILKVDNGAWTVGAAPSGLPSVSSTDNGKMLQVSNGAWAAVTYTAPVTSVNGNTGAVTTTDEKVKQTDINGANNGKGILLASGLLSNGNSSTSSVYSTNKLIWNDSSAALYIYNSNKSQYSLLTSSQIVLTDSSTGYSGTLQTDNITEARRYKLPNTAGTIALTSDIPDVSSFYTKPSGGIPATDLAETYLTSHQDISGLAPKASPVFTGSISLDRAPGTIGTNSFAVGSSTSATGQNAHAEGESTLAQGNNSHAEGYSSDALAVCSHAEGYDTTAGGNHSHAEGNSTSASGLYSHAEGLQTTVNSNTGAAGHAEGYSTVVDANYAHAEGQSTIAAGTASHAEGQGGTVTYNGTSYASGARGTADHVEGYQCLTLSAQPGNHAEGYSTKATGGAAHTEGNNTVASGNASHAEGNATTASVANAHAEGYSTTASGHASHAEGAASTASGGQAHAEGGGTTASGSNSHSEGNGTIANHASQHAFGAYNVADTSEALATANGNYIEIVGNGTANNARSNARALDWDGNERLMGQIYVGCNADSTGGTQLTPPVGMTGATSSTAGTAGYVPAPSAGDNTKFLRGDGTWGDGGMPMVILSYGNSTWDDFEAAYNNNVIVYTRASSNSNPATGSQTRMAFMAYVNNSTTPTEVEFQYYRSMSSHSATAMGDQVFVYKLTKTGGWSVTTRDASIKEINVESGSKLGVSWSGNKVTLSNTMTAADMPMSSSDATTVSAAISALNTLPAVTSTDNGKILRVVNGEWAVVSISDASGVSF